MTDMRDKIGKAIIETFNEAYLQYGPEEANYDPDTCWYAADAVIAALASELLDLNIEARHHPTIISHARYVAKTSAGEVMLPVSDNLL